MAKSGSSRLSKKKPVGTTTVLFIRIGRWKKAIKTESALPIARQWEEDLSRRSTWIYNQDTYLKRCIVAKKHLLQLGLTESNLKKIGEATLIEMIFEKSATSGYEARIPWEFLLSAGARDYRAGAAGLVIRRVGIGSAAHRVSNGGALIIGGENCADNYQGELDGLSLLSRSVGMRDVRIEKVADVKAFQHLLDSEACSSEKIDGSLFVIHDARGIADPESVDRRWYLDREGKEAINLAQIKDLTPIYKRAFAGLFLAPCSGIPAMYAVESGLPFSIAIQDSCDRATVLRWCFAFVQASRSGGWSRGVAAVRAEQLRATEEGINMRGGGVIIVVGGEEHWEEQVCYPALSLGASNEEEALPVIAEEACEQKSVSPFSLVAIAKAELSSAELYHGVSPWDVLRLYIDPKFYQGHRLEVCTQLSSPRFNAEYWAEANERRTINDLCKQVKLPYSSTWTSEEDAPLATLSVTVHDEGNIVHRRSFPIRLLSRGEWVDTPEQGHWIAAHVQPGGKGIAELVRDSLPFFRAIADEPGAGFDAYQFASLEDSERVAKQIRSIWFYLSEIKRLRYCNPLPSFGLNTQRVRRPEQVLLEGFGTCLDLTVLMASIFEWIDIFPVVVMYQDHAVAGYWTSSEAFDGRFDYPSPSQMGSASQKPWKSYYSRGAGAKQELCEHVREGRIVLLECVGLTNGSSFLQACADAETRLLSPGAKFDSFIDIHRARIEGKVLPVPSAD